MTILEPRPLDTANMDQKPLLACSGVQKGDGIRTKGVISRECGANMDQRHC